MGGDSLKKVKSGDPLRIPARTFNTFIDSARDYLQRSQSSGGRPTQSVRQTGIALVKNDSGTDVDRFAVLQITGPLFTPTENEQTFRNQVALTGSTPSAGGEGLFVVCQEPIASGALGRCMVAGVTPVQVNVTAEAHEWAEIASGQTGYLASAASGSAQILCVESGTGTKWAYVRLGPPVGETGGGSTVFLAKVISSQGSAIYTVREQVYNATGTLVDKDGTSNVSATNLAEMSQGDGDAVDTGEFVLVLATDDTADPPVTRYSFDRAVYAKYLD